VVDWSRSLVALAELAVIYSTLLAIVDGFPRMLENFLAELGWVNTTPESHRRNYLLLLAIVVLAAAGFLSFFLSSFTAFIDLVTIIGFIAAPVVALANYLVINGSNVPESARPGPALKLWSHCAVLALLVASLSFLYFRFVN
jgi:hypothetical protein